ncbi:MAG: hypothetical protein ACLFNT_09330 [Spirochaetales bacterium]
MKRTRPMVLPLTLIAAVLMIAACENPAGAPKIETIEFDEVGGYYVYRTNDDANLDTARSYSILPGTSDATESEIEIVKESGNSQGWIGMVFNREDNSNYYAFLVTVGGSYAYYKVESGSLTAIDDGTLPAAIDYGYGKTLTINATYPADSPITIQVNGTTVFTDSSPFVPFTGDAVGGLVDVEPVENFPDDPVEVKFRVTKPFTSP